MQDLRLSKGTPVVDLAAGREIGSVDRVLLDTERNEIIGFTVVRGGLLGHRLLGVIDVGDVHAFGVDAVTVQDAAALRSELALASHAGDLVDLDSLLGRAVVTEGGVALGRVAAVHFGESSRRLQSLQVDGGAGQPSARVDGEQVTTYGDDFVVVADAAAAPMDGRQGDGRFFYVVGGSEVRRAG